MEDFALWVAMQRVSYNDIATAILIVYNFAPTKTSISLVVTAQISVKIGRLGGSVLRTQWNVTKDFYMGLDVMYAKLTNRTSITWQGLFG